MPNNQRRVFGNPEYWQQVHGKFPTFFEIVPRLTDSLNDLTRREHPGAEPYQRVILDLGVLTGVSMWELVTLAGNGFGLGAMKIARTVMESAINAEYLRQYPQECDLYLDWHYMEQYKSLVYIREHLPKLLLRFSAEKVMRVEAEYAKHRDKFARADGELRRSWCAIDLSARAARTGFADVYRLINPISSQLIHGTFGGLARHFDLTEDEDRIAIPPSIRYCGEALSGGHACTMQMVETLAKAFNWTPCNPITTLQEDFHRAWNPNGT